jgi:chorismate mutase
MNPESYSPGNHLSRDLGEIRREILKLDLEILELLHERLQLAEEAGERKRQEGKQLRDEDREEELLRILTGHTENEELVEEVWRRIFDHSLRAQTDESDEIERPEKPKNKRISQDEGPEAAEEVSLGDTPDPDTGTSEYWWMRKRPEEDWQIVRVDGRHRIHQTTSTYMPKIEDVPDSTEWSGPIRRPGEAGPAKERFETLLSKCLELSDMVGYGTNWKGERWCVISGEIIENEELANLLADVEAAARDV